MFCWGALFARRSPTLESRTKHYTQWDGDLNVIKDRVKDSIEQMAATWTADEKQQCVDATAAAFAGGGAINSYLTTPPGDARL
jgi:heme oxygenase (biliverdin-producing, ferredoxin)